MSALPLRPFRLRTPHARQAAAGRAVRELFELHGRMVHAVCRLNLRDRLDAEDATQQTFLAAYRSLLGGPEPTDPPAWLATIARNECSRIRKQRPVTVPIDDSEGVEGADVTSAAERREEIDALAVALSELAPSQREAVVLREFYGLSYKEVAAALGVSGAAVESLLFKGRKRLQEKLGSLRVAGAVVLPETVRDALAQALPGFGSGGAAAAGAKVVAFPAAAKLAAVAVVVTGGGALVSGTVHEDPARPKLSRITATDKSAKRPATPAGDSRPRATSTPAGAPLAHTRQVPRTPAAVLDGEREEGPDEADEALQEAEDEAAEREDERKEDQVTPRAEKDDDASEDEDERAEPEDDDTADSDAGDTLDD